MATVLGQRLLFLGLVAILLAAPAWAQFGVPWQRTPMIAVISADDSDPRHALVDEAIDFWNRMLQEINSGFRLGPPVRHVMPIPEEGLRTLSTSIVDRGGASVQVPPSLRGLRGRPHHPARRLGLRVVRRTVRFGRQARRRHQGSEFQAIELAERCAECDRAGDRARDWPREQKR